MYGFIVLFLLTIWPVEAQFGGTFAFRQGELGTPLLLDNHTGAAAAYSLRQLDKDYTGPAIRVRRNSDNAEQDIGFADNVLNESALLAFAGAGDAFVKIWYDQSGNGNDLRQISYGSQPQIVNSGNLIQQNTLPTIPFDGTNDNLDNTNFSLSGSFSLFIVSTFDPEISFNPLIDAINASAQRILFGRGGNGANNAIQFFDGANVAGSVVEDTSFALRAGIRDSSNNLEIFRNGTTYASGSGGGNDMSSLRVGGDEDLSSHTEANISEIIFFSNDKSTSRTEIENDINNFYSVY
mgnify:CR=1 FL=1